MYTCRYLNGTAVDYLIILLISHKMKHVTCQIPCINKKNNEVHVLRELSIP